MTRGLAQILGIVVAALVLIGLTVGNGHWLGLLNIDTGLDLLRIPIALALLYAGFIARDTGVVRSVVMTVGGLYIAMGLIGLVSRDLLGLAPNGLTWFDIVFHLGTGVLAVWAANHSHVDRHVPMHS